MASSILQMLDMAPDHTSSPRPLGDVRNIQAPALVEDTTVVMAFASERVVINCSDISSCDIEKHALGNSSNKNSDNNDVGVDQGVSLPSTGK